MSCTAVFGLGRSGLAVAKAVISRGGKVVVVDEATHLAKPEFLAQARSLKIPVITQWQGEFSDLQPIDAVVSNPAVPMDHPRLRAALAAGIPVISEVEYAYRISRAPIVAITGTNGKSTTTVMTWLILKALGVNVRLCGNLYGSGYPEETLTEAALSAEEDEVLVAEVSSFQLEWVSEFRPVAAAITTITEDHLNRYGGSMALYTATKRRIWSAQGKDQVAVAREGSESAAFARALQGPQVRTFGPGGDLDLTHESQWIPHNRLNAATAGLLAQAVMAGRGNCVTKLDEAVRTGLEGFKGLAHRMEELGSRNGVAVINNSMCTNPEAVVASASSRLERVHLLVGGVNKGLDFHPVKEYLTGGKDQIYLYGQDRFSIGQVMGRDVPTVETLEEAFLMAATQAKGGEVIMLAPGCASTDQFRDFVDRGNVFKSIVQSWLDS